MIGQEVAVPDELFGKKLKKKVRWWRASSTEHVINGSSVRTSTVVVGL